MRLRLTVGRGGQIEEWEIPDDATPDEIAEEIYDKAIPHLMSSIVEAVWDPEKKEGIVTVGGWRPVGKAVIIDGAKNPPSP